MDTREDLKNMLYDLLTLSSKGVTLEIMPPFDANTINAIATVSNEMRIKITEALRMLEDNSFDIKYPSQMEIEEATKSVVSLDVFMKTVKKQYIESVVRCSSNKSEAARKLDIQRTYLSRIYNQWKNEAS